MAHKVGEVFEQDGKYFMTLDKENPKGPHVQLHIYLASENGNGTSTLTRYWLPGSDIFGIATALEEFIARLGGFSQAQNETFMIETPTKGV